MRYRIRVKCTEMNPVEKVSSFFLLANGLIDGSISSSAKIRMLEDITGFF